MVAIEDTVGPPLALVLRQRMQTLFCCEFQWKSTGWMLILDFVVELRFSDILKINTY